MEKHKVLILFGGASSEHEVSIMSAASVMKAMDKSRYEVVAAGITPEGIFELYEEAQSINEDAWPGFEEPRFSHKDGRETLFLAPGAGGFFVHHNGILKKLEVDVVFPVLHGPYGEDGRLQGLLDMCGIPYVGAGVLSSAIAMDKGIAKRLLHQAGISQTEHLEYRIDHETSSLLPLLQEIPEKLGLPVFVKPANLGSSVGISKAKSLDELEKALKVASSYDTKVIVERAVHAREIECAVLGSQDPQASLPAEVLPSHDFYDYEDKYFSGASRTQVPADLTPEEEDNVRQTAIRVYRLLECQGLARVDFFLDRDSGKLLVNEVNTMPGFTKISLYPKMWEATGVPYPELIHRIIVDALEKSTRKQGSIHSRAR